jgi:hypothetical protein
LFRDCASAVRVLVGACVAGHDALALEETLAALFALDASRPSVRASGTWDENISLNLLATRAA